MKKKITVTLFFSLLIFIFVTMSAYAKMPPIQSGTGNNSGGTVYSTIGFSFMIDGYITSISLADEGVITATDSTTPLYNNSIKIIEKANRERILQVSLEFINTSGIKSYFNIAICLTPPNFDIDNPVIGRSLLDNLYLEGYNKTSLNSLLIKGNNIGWINGILSLRKSNETHSTFSAKKLWKNGKANYSKPLQVYTTDKITQATTWTPATLKNLEKYFNNQGTIPPILEVDKIPPTSTVNIKGSTSLWRNTNLTVTVTPSDSGGSGLEGMWIIQNQKSTMPSDSDGGWGNKYTSAKNIILSANGKNYIHVWLRDNAGNVTRNTYGPYNIDKTAPNLLATKPSSEWKKEDINISIISTDDLSGIESIWTIINQNKTIPADNNSSWIKSNKNNTADIIIKDSGENYVHVWTKDNAGNITRATYGPYKLDKVTPSISLTPDFTDLTDSDITITIKGEDSHSGVKMIILPDGTEIEKNITTFKGEGNGQYEFLIIDNAGNIANKSIDLANIDKTLPIITILPYKVDWTNNSITVYAEVKNGTLNYTSYTFNSNSSFTFVATNQLGKRAEKTVTITNIDKTLPDLMLIKD